MCEAPASVDEKQLMESGIKVSGNEKE